MYDNLNDIDVFLINKVTQLATLTYQFAKYITSFSIGSGDPKWTVFPVYTYQLEI